jgi:2-hydroxy-3-keto-5-methylthiopentenyl-1-phosphate phosphatase
VSPIGAAGAAAGPPYIVVCDFDGTITVDDVTDLIWNRYLSYDWRQVLLPLSRAGRRDITALEHIARGYADVAQPPEALLAAVLPLVRLRAGFDGLVALCRARGWPIQVVSHGLAFYIERLLPPGVPLTCFEGRFEGGRWHVTLPATTALPEGADFKMHAVERLRARHPGHATAYVGDGRLDFPAARRCEAIFAVRGSPLAALCRGESLPCVEFDHFDEVGALLAP